MNENQQLQNPRFLLVDGMALLFRAYFATAVTGQFMYNSKGTPTNGIYGFMKHFLMGVNHFNPSHVAVCWDMGSKTFRTDMYNGYKSNRPEAPIELVPQFELAKDMVASFDIPNIGVTGYEADDCIGTLSQVLKEEAEVVILTGDRDILQVLDKNVSVALLKKGMGNYEVHTPDSFYEEKGIQPRQLIDLKAFMGDPSDNYPGVKGIGEKTALKLLQTYEHIEGVLENIEALTKGQKTKIEQDLDMLHLSRQLAEIKCDVPVECTLVEAEWKYNVNKVNQKLEEIELRGIAKLLRHPAVI
ncbi:5'-3' exonuclease [Cytobacillus kochii]|uniref:5'-3' exonuclease n=2 Tax=Bacillaceae TaxID=186817 RepID=UPI00278595AF|nr:MULTISPECIES: 5'-3' exonuclease [Cytobacillus]MDQ0184002.1 5'-3' exonuclease [Cytobacillus kochii]MEA1852815.1 5'-3' exonuclease [Cytobacillus sp. OWB-43]MED1604311.1 5'-3' exonuclease [Cytobacillus kochii]